MLLSCHSKNMYQRNNLIKILTSLIHLWGLFSRMWGLMVMVQSLHFYEINAKFIKKKKRKTTVYIIHVCFRDVCFLKWLARWGS